MKKAVFDFVKDVGKVALRRGTINILSKKVEKSVEALFERGREVLPLGNKKSDGEEDEAPDEDTKLTRLRKFRDLLD